MLCKTTSVLFVQMIFMSDPEIRNSFIFEYKVIKFCFAAVKVHCTL